MRLTSVLGAVVANYRICAIGVRCLVRKQAGDRERRQRRC